MVLISSPILGMLAAMLFVLFMNLTIVCFFSFLGKFAAGTSLSHWTTNLIFCGGVD